MSEDVASQGDTGADDVDTSNVDSQDTSSQPDTGADSGADDQGVDQGGENQEPESDAPAIPETADGYTFNQPEWMDHKVDEGTLETAREFAHNKKWSQEDYQEAVEFVLQRDKRHVELYEQQQEETREGVKKEMGDKLQSNLDQVRRTLRAFEMDVPEDDNDILDNPALFHFVLRAGEKISEDNLGDSTGHGGGESGGDIADDMFDDMFDKK